MEKSIKYFNTLLLLVLSVFSFSINISCAPEFWGSAVRVHFTITNPPEIDISKYQKVAIIDIEGNLGDEFYNNLFSKLSGSEYLTVIDRIKLKEIVRDNKMSLTALYDDSLMLKLGKMSGVSAIIKGKYNGEYSESIKEELIEYKKTKYLLFTREGEYVTEGIIDFIDIETGEVIISELLGRSAKDYTYGKNTNPDEIDIKRLVNECISSDINAFYRIIAPWTKNVETFFVKDRKFQDSLNGIELVKIGMMEDAIQIFSNVVIKAESSSEAEPKNIAEAYWNLGLAYEYSWEFDKATKCFNKAYDFHPDNKYIKENENVEKLKKTRQQLIIQGFAK